MLERTGTSGAREFQTKQGIRQTSAGSEAKEKDESSVSRKSAEDFGQWDFLLKTKCDVKACIAVSDKGKGSDR